MCVRAPHNLIVNRDHRATHSLLPPLGLSRQSGIGVGVRGARGGGEEGRREEEGAQITIENPLVTRERSSHWP